MNLRPYQTAAADALENHERGIVAIPCGGGKTIVAAEVCRRHAERCTAPRVLWLAGTREQLGQAHDAFLALCGSQWPPERLFVTCPSGADSCPWPIETATLLIVDECHHAGASSWRAVIERTRCPRYGFSATPERADDLAAVVHELLGPVVYRIGHEELRAAGNLAGGTVTVIDCDPDPGTMQAVTREAKGDTLETIGRDAPDWRKRRLWQALLKHGVIRNETRNAVIVRGARYHLDLGHSVLVIVGTVAHGEALAERIGGGAALVHSKLPAKVRRARIASFADGSLPCLIATSLADEGLDVPRASVLFLATANRSGRLAEQRAGRILRSMAGKPEARVYDFLDDWHPWLAAQSRNRTRTYEGIGLVVKECKADQRRVA